MSVTVVSVQVKKLAAEFWRLGAQNAIEVDSRGLPYSDWNATIDWLEQQGL